MSPEALNLPGTLPPSEDEEGGLFPVSGETPELP